MHLDIEGKLADEQELAKLLLGESYFLDDPEIIQHTQSIIQYCRINKNQRTKLDAFMEQYGLSNSEGIALMCLAESLVRIPDNKTRDALINEKLTSAFNNCLNFYFWIRFEGGKIDQCNFGHVR